MIDEEDFKIKVRSSKKKPVKDSNRMVKILDQVRIYVLREIL